MHTQEHTNAHTHTHTSTSTGTLQVVEQRREARRAQAVHGSTNVGADACAGGRGWAQLPVDAVLEAELQELVPVAIGDVEGTLQVVHGLARAPQDGVPQLAGHDGQDGGQLLLHHNNSKHINVVPVPVTWEVPHTEAVLNYW
eukprot:CAMPEP_0177648904 /NCGR_PEP_ID=MMETSP0447-20121125/11082_1 /TAXON_ID=0 /ORGANISM="Stygamoeba regulata, Strain BSH-02190019" /LENGTH=141 /DNA_ID=CAMNT_0019151587 /DNA_START=240 /DNA_END=662 /DNA_ORIENTATION=-